VKYALLALAFLCGCAAQARPAEAEPKTMEHVQTLAPNVRYEEMDKHRQRNIQLAAIAQELAERMATNKTLLHTDLQQHVKLYGVLAENVAFAQSLDGAYAIWFRSSEHLGNYNGPFKYYGIGKADGIGGTYYCIIYSSRIPW